MRTLVWFRGKDPRLDDHRPLADALVHGEVVPLFVLDPYFFAPERAQRLPHRMQFLLESLGALARHVECRGSRLLVVPGKSVEIVPRLAAELRVDRVVAQRWCEPFARERDRRVAAALDVPFELFEGETLNPLSFGALLRASPATSASTALARTVGAAGRSTMAHSSWFGRLKGRSGTLCLAALLVGCGDGGDLQPPGVETEGVTTTPEQSGIQHVVVVMMENRSFDHLLGWLPGADGRQAGLTYVDRTGAAHPTYPLAPDYQGCDHSDPDHSYEGGRIEYDDGASDGWLRAGQNDDYAIGYYERADLRFLGQAAPRWTTLDRYFASIMAETYPNRIYQHAAQVDRLANTLDISALPTIWDRLADAGRSGRYYYSDVPFLALWGAKYLPISHSVATFVSDALTGRLPDVAFVDPPFLEEASGTSSDDHPHADIRRGEAFLDLIYSAVTLGPAFRSTVLVINFDEWGGFFDHVPPPTAPIPDSDRLAGNEDGRLGFRTPAVLVAPWARSNYVSHLQFDHTSVLKLIEWRWGLAPLSVRDQTARNLAEALDFTRHTRPPLFVVPPGPATPCALPQATEDVSLSSLANLAPAFGFPVYR